jgi:hypothetical protein
MIHRLLIFSELRDRGGLWAPNLVSVWNLEKMIGSGGNLGILENRTSLPERYCKSGEPITDLHLAASSTWGRIVFSFASGGGGQVKYFSLPISKYHQRGPIKGITIMVLFLAFEHG